MKKITIFILFLAFNFTSKAQINFSIGKSVYPFTAPGFQTFFQTYNASFTDLKTPFKPDFPTAGGWSWRAGYLIGNHDDGAGVYYNSTTGVNSFKTSNEVEFNNGEKRRLVLQIRDWATDVSLGVGSDNFHIALNGTMVLHSNKLFCSYIFSDGSESFGIEHNLNGIFSASRLTGGYGAEVGLGVKYLQLVFRISKIYKPFQKDGSTYLNYYSDLNEFKLNASLNGNSTYPAEYMPADYTQFLADQLTSETNNNFVYINDRGWQFGLSLMFLIPTNN